MNNGMIKEMNSNNKQQGFVAIFTVIIIMAILSLITLGFSNITRQALRRTLDDQLNSQAFYAAETGINRAWRYIDGLDEGAGASGPVSLTYVKDSCPDPADDYGYAIDPSANISISCLLVNMVPEDFDPGTVPVAGTNPPIRTYVKPLDPVNPNEFTFSWDTDDSSDLRNAYDERPNNGFDGNNNPVLPPKANWGTGGRNIGILRVDIVPADNLARANMVNEGYTFFLYPTSHSSGSTAFSVYPGQAYSSQANHQGAVLLVRCADYNPATDPDDFRRCSVDITLAGAAHGEYYMRLVSYYNPVRVSVVMRDGSGIEQQFYGAQAVIDATGKVDDVSRRVQVRVPIKWSKNDYPGFAENFSILSASSLCKRLAGKPGTTTYNLGGLSPAPTAQETSLCDPISP